jgi:hypothetical protein
MEEESYSSMLLIKKTKRNMAIMIIKPYIDKEKDSIGLSDLGLNSFPKTATVTEIPIIFGKFLTGFDPNAFYLDTFDEKTKEKEKKAIINKIKDFDLKFPHFRVGDVEVKTNHQGEHVNLNSFYADLFLELKAEMTILNSESPIDQVKMEIIKTNAKYNPNFEVAPDLHTARESNRKYKYYISNADRDVDQEVTKKKEMNKAISILDNLSENDKEGFLLIIKYLLPANKGLNTESNNRLYKRGDDYINGIIDGDKAKGGDVFYKNFIKASEIDREELFTKVLIKYAIMTNVIRINNNTKEWEYSKTHQELGKTPEDIYRIISLPKNMDLLKEIKTDTEQDIKIV